MRLQKTLEREGREESGNEGSPRLDDSQLYPTHTNVRVRKILSHEPCQCLPG